MSSNLAEVDACLTRLAEHIRGINARLDKLEQDVLGSIAAAESRQAAVNVQVSGFVEQVVVRQIAIIDRLSKLESK